MRAFLSHSSLDKGFVDAVASNLRPGTFELDALTFDAGILNSQAIIQALNRSDLFCLFLSEHSAAAPYVEFETLLGIDLVASGKIGRFLAICLDDKAFALANDNVKSFNIVRKSLSPEAAARLIQGALLSAHQLKGRDAHPFLGRESELIDLETQVTNHACPESKAIYVSGNAGSGRRTIARKFYETQFPNVNKIFPAINIDDFSGLDELYRKVLSALRPNITAGELRTRIQGFAAASSTERPRLVAQLLNSLSSANEAALLIDNGGLLTDAGELTAEINQVVGHLNSRPHPSIALISTRMISKRLRRSENDLAYVAVKSLNRQTSTRLMSKLLRDNNLSVSTATLDELVRLADGHPFNFYRIVEDCVERGVDPFLANPSEYIEWKHRYSSEYIKRIKFNLVERNVLALLLIVPELDFDAIVTALPMDKAELSNSLQRLGHLHVVETNEDRFTIAPSIRIAVERDRRIRLSPDVQNEATHKLAHSLAVRLEEGTAQVALVDAAILAALETNNSLSGFAAAFLLPSHHVWMAKRHYDQKRWGESIRASKEAIQGSGRLSVAGQVAAFRYLCLAAARLGEYATFADGMRGLEKISTTSWAKSNVAFLKGFNERLKGNLPVAERLFDEAYSLSPGNSSVGRELAAVCLARGDLDRAEYFGREAHSHAPNNPYNLDILIAVLVRKHGREAKHSSEIDMLFSALEADDRESGRSFYTTRKAQLEHLWGNNKLALELIEQAIKKTPHIFEPHHLKAEILLKEGNAVKAIEEINLIREIVNARDPNERRSNYRLYMETLANYYVEVGRFDEARSVYRDSTLFVSIR
jgi:Flp pilus assembly protein TadD